MTGDAAAASIALRDLRLCFEGLVPAVVATASVDGTPNVTYLSRVRMVDDGRIALSNQFFSKTSRNLAENPRASVILVDPSNYRQYRLSVVYERTDRQGRVFELLHEDVEAVAALQGMQHVFKLRGADIYRVLHVELVPAARSAGAEVVGRSRPGPGDAPGLLAELSTRLGRCPDLNTLVVTAVDGLADLFGYGNCSLMLLDETGTRLYTIASRGYDAEGVGSEVPVGEGVVGMAAARCRPIRLGNLHQMDKYGRSVRRAYEAQGDIAPGREVPVPGLSDAESRVAVPAMALGQLVGVLVVESSEQLAFTEEDESLLTVVASLVGNAIEIERARERAADAPVAGRPEAAAPVAPAGTPTRVRFFPVDGSTFLEGDYLIKGVAGRLLWSLLRQHQEEGRVDFTNREVRLDRSLELPEFRDNFENRLVLLKRRLDERHAPVRIEKTGRGRFRLEVATGLVLELVETRG